MESVAGDDRHLGMTPGGLDARLFYHPVAKQEVKQAAMGRKGCTGREGYASYGVRTFLACRKGTVGGLFYLGGEPSHLQEREWRAALSGKGTSPACS